MAEAVNHRPAGLRLLLSDVAAARHGARIRAAVPAVDLIPVAPEGPLPDPAGAEVAFITRDLFVGGTRFRLTPRFQRFIDLLAANPDLRWVQTFSAGTDMAPYQAMLARGLLLTNAAGASASAVAQTAVTGLLALARGLPRIAEAQRPPRLGTAVCRARAARGRGPDRAGHRHRPDRPGDRPAVPRLRPAHAGPPPRCRGRPAAGLRCGRPASPRCPTCCRAPTG